MLTVVDLFSCFSTSMINIAIHGNSNGYSNESSTTAERWPPYRSYDVIMNDDIIGHKNYVNNYSQIRDRAVGEVSLCLSRQDASNDMQYDLPGPFIRSGHLTWPKVKFSNWPFVVKIYTFFRPTFAKMPLKGWRSYHKCRSYSKQVNDSNVRWNRPLSENVAWMPCDSCFTSHLGNIIRWL